MPAPRVTAGNAFEAQPAAFKRTVLLHRLNHVMRAGRRIAAGIGQIRRKHHLISPHNEDEDGFHREFLKPLPKWGGVGVGFSYHN